MLPRQRRVDWSATITLSRSGFSTVMHFPETAINRLRRNFESVRDSVSLTVPSSDASTRLVVFS